MGNSFSLMQTIGQQGAGRKGVRPHTTDMLLAAAGVERKHGTMHALEALLSAYMSAVGTMAMAGNGGPEILDHAVEHLRDALNQMERLRGNLADGVEPSHGIMATITIKNGGRA